jgi:uncharacterized protein VirK/YbjX
MVGRAFASMGSCIQVLRLIRLPVFAEVARTNPTFTFKYLTRDYLARGLTATERAACFLHHYQRLRATMPDGLLRQILQSDVVLHEIRESGHCFAVKLSLSRPIYKEGELCLKLHVDGDIVFDLSFTIVPGWVVNSEVADTLLITRLQGVKGYYDPISRATKTLHDVAPSALLLAALQGVACALGVGEIAGVNATRQTCYTSEFEAAFKADYDDFFANLGMARNASGFFLSTVPIEDKPLAVIKRGHKLRTKEKRAFKRQITEDVSRLLGERLSAKNTEPSRAGHAAPIAAVLGS